MTVETIPMDRAEAQRITERIRLKLDSVAAGMDALGALVADAYQRRADLAMGYDSWAAYADAEFAEQTRNLAAPIRRELVGRLTEASMSTPAIAPVMGVTQQAVHRTQQRITDAQVTTRVVTSPDPLAEEKAEGRVVKLTGPGSLLHSEPVEHIDMETGEVLAEPRTVVGLDGKTYTRKEKPSETAERIIAEKQAKPQRRPITDAFWEGVYDTSKQVDGLRRLVDDDRFIRNREALAQKNQHEIQRAINTLSEVLTALQSNS